MKPPIPRATALSSPAQWIDRDVLAAFREAGTNAHRIYSSPGAWIERFGDDLLLSYKSDNDRDRVLADLPGRIAELGLTHRRLFGKHLPKQNSERIAPVCLEGNPATSLLTTVEEEGIKFGLDFGAGYSAGFFIDQRANRALLRRAPAKRLLNTFAYTCSFSVVAALAGAHTTSIELSRKSIDRGRANFALNQLDPTPHRFIADDVLERLPRLAAKGETFDAIILDPPTFSRGNGGRRWQVESDLETLVLQALALAAPKARILLSTNCTRLDRRALETVARFALKGTRRSAEFHQTAALPDVPAGTAANTLWLFLK